MSERPRPHRSTRPGEPDRVERSAAELDGFLDAVDGIGDALDAEITGSTWWASAQVLGADLNETILRVWLPACEDAANPPSAAMLAMLTPYSHPIVAAALAEALSRLRAAGVRPPRWADELAVPPTPSDCVELRPMDGDALLLAARFDRPTTSDALLIVLGTHGVAEHILPLDAAELPEVIAAAHRAAEERVVLVTLSPADFRERVEYALAARGTLDANTALDLADVVPDEDGPRYHALVPLVRARLRGLP